ncbi:hypothetical protein ACFQWB_14900 [Paenibacillus thermoaerophilus]|uniref:LPXTG-motif cell wall anchor domain-containing protein n=1 Tax=Paenibacillus thermoaerophilus TaxID=1215385 RepID=A0ABW2V8U7_9BACL|nr:hypothetical protein [Paenibacillus thermoaerophilus]TMV04307.1 hypothetical protein FE781_17205 [Paenibacillus thermoaerophilus]
MLYRLLSLTLAFSFLWGAQYANACSPKPWSYEMLAEESPVMVQGEVSTSSNNGRQTTIKVINYVGPGIAPKIIHLPATKSSRTTNDDACPDFSMTLQQGKTYLIFLKNADSTPELLHPDWTTALEVADHNVVVNMQGDKEEVNALLQKYASDHKLTVKEPDQNSPVWGTDNNNTVTIFIATVAIFVIVIGGIYVIRRKRLK